MNKTKDPKKKVPAPEGQTLGRLLDEYSNIPPQEVKDQLNSGCGNEALRLARFGIRVFPLIPGSKEPATEHGFKDATTDAEQIRKWWTKNPNYNLGIRTGCDSGLVVIDVDVKDGANGPESLRGLEAKHGKLPPTYTVSTPSGGKHYYFWHPGSSFHIPSTNGTLRPGIDVRGDGGYIVAPPSVLDDGPYTGENTVYLAELPEWLLDLLVKQPSDDGQSSQDYPRPSEDQLIDALRSIGADDYDDWLHVGMALHSWDPERGLPLWINWSRQSAKFEEGVCEAKWKTFKGTNSNGDSVTVGTIFHLARQYAGQTSPVSPNSPPPPVQTSPTSPNSPGGDLRRPLETAIYPQDSFLSDYMDHARRIEESADSYLLAGILGVVAGALARRVYFPWGDRRFYPNVYGMLVGKPGDRKSSAITHAERLAREALAPMSFLPLSLSAEALFDQYDKCPDRLLIADDANPILGSWRNSGYGEQAGQQFLRLYDCMSLSEAFLRNQKDGGEKNGKSERATGETSTSIVFGATFNIWRFEGHGIQDGIQRRFLYYGATKHGRFIPIAQPTDDSSREDLLRQLLRLAAMNAKCSFSPGAKSLWEAYQSQNRHRLQSDVTDEEAARLNGAPMQVLKAAMIFQACIWAHTDDEAWDGVIDHGTMKLAVDHVDHCLDTAMRLTDVGDRETIVSDADIFYAKVLADFPPDDSGVIKLSKSRLTAKYCSHGLRGLRNKRLYGQLLPNLVSRGLAEGPIKEGKTIFYEIRPDGG